jgi:plasmid stabilization system protein ParE
LEENLKFHPKAEEEFHLSYDWHEQNRKNSGESFVNSVNNKLIEIQNNPEGRSADERGVRWASISKFPYKIFYIFKKPIVWILAVWHNSRTPDSWKKRIDNI